MCINYYRVYYITMKEGEYTKGLVNSQKHLVSKLLEDELLQMLEKGSVKNEEKMTTLAQVWDYLEDTRKTEE
jgi:hypothetical protein